MTSAACVALQRNKKKRQWQETISTLRSDETDALAAGAAGDEGAMAAAYWLRIAAEAMEKARQAITGDPS
jgi:hypothetical protein